MIYFMLFFSGFIFLGFMLILFGNSYLLWGTSEILIKRDYKINKHKIHVMKKGIEGTLLGLIFLFIGLLFYTEDIFFKMLPQSLFLLSLAQFITYSGVVWCFKDKFFEPTKVKKSSMIVIKVGVILYVLISFALYFEIIK